MSAKREYLWQVFSNIPQSKQLVETALIFYHCAIPVEQAREYLSTLSTKIKESK